MQKQKRTVEPSHSDADIVWGMDPQSVEVVTKTYRAWLSRASRVRDEALRFAQDRIEKELEVGVQLARCTSPTEAFTVQAEFASKMAADYLAESQKMIELMGEIAKDVTSSPIASPAHH